MQEMKNWHVNNTIFFAFSELAIWVPEFQIHTCTQMPRWKLWNLFAWSPWCARAAQQVSIIIIAGASSFSIYMCMCMWVCVCVAGKLGCRKQMWFGARLGELLFSLPSQMLTWLLACYAHNNVFRLQSVSEKMQAVFCFGIGGGGGGGRLGKKILKKEECGSLFFLKALQLQNGCDQKTIAGSFHPFVLKP